MPRLILRFENLHLGEYGVGPSVTIGRLPDNTVVINNPTVSGHHARVYRDGDGFRMDIQADVLDGLGHG